MLRAPAALALVLAALGDAPSTALASVGAEQAAGRALAQQVQSGKRSCDSLSADDLDHIGEFVMGRMIGSSSAHEAMNARMIAVIGAPAESRMHQVLGARFAGCTTNTRNGAYHPMMGGQGMMGSGPRDWAQGDWSTMMGAGDWGSIMRSRAWTQMMGSSRDWSWMTASNWKHMSAADWQTVQRRMLGTSAARTMHGGWDTRNVVLVTLAVVLAGGLTGLLLVRRPWRRSTN
ncbi:MAG TPA: hypothetical protein VF024_03290 [Solirubrobacteraceae bacterium]